VSEQGRLILVDPSLPAQALAPRFNERTGKQLSDVTDVFCTTLRPVHRRSIEALAQARWWCSESELESYSRHLLGLLDSAGRMTGRGAGGRSAEAPDEESSLIAAELKLLERFKPAPDKFSPQVGLYPLPGASEGSAGLLLTPATNSIIIAGDAVLTGEHLQRAMVWEGCTDLERARHSMEDVLEVADVIIPGHDNVVLSPGRWI
jgi:glyoxylase-like metal-dependent hydrolase (beta-lactamase superfamily II)